MTTSNNLGLILNDQLSGDSTRFFDWQLDINGLSSNMLLIDNWAGYVNDNIDIFYLQRGSIVANANYIGDNLYVANVSSIQSLSINMKINIVFDTNNLGAVLLNINDLGSKPLYKIDSNGNMSGLYQNDIIANRRYIFNYNGYAWIWVDAISSDQITINSQSSSASMITIVSSGSGIISSNISASSVVLSDMRCGGNENDWSIGGDNFYNANIKIVCGSKRFSFFPFTDPLISGSGLITFPESFSCPPIVFISSIFSYPTATLGYSHYVFRARNITSNNFFAQWKLQSSQFGSNLYVYWMAIGPR